MTLRRFYAFIGVLLIGAAVAGLIISVAGTIGLWRVQRRITVGLDNAFALLDTTLQATTDGLDVAGQSLDQADQSLDTLVATIQTTGQTVSDTLPLIDAISQVTVHDLPVTISSTQTALASAQASAQVVDVTLAALTSIPFLPLAQYQPAVPLSDALGTVSDSLDHIPASLVSLEHSLATASTNLQTIEAQFDRIAADIDGLGLSLAAARSVINQYGQVVATLQAQLALARDNLPRQIDTIAWFITLALIWLGLTQVGLLMQGLEMLGLEYAKPRRAPEAALAPVAPAPEPAPPSTRPEPSASAPPAEKPAEPDDPISPDSAVPPT